MNHAAPPPLLSPVRGRRGATRRRLLLIVTAMLALAFGLTSALPAHAASYARISGEGSSWAGAAWTDWVSQAANQGVTVDYTPNGSSVGRDDFARQTNAVFADSEIPFSGDASDPQDKTTPAFKYGLLPVVAGGTAFMYNLPVGGNRFENLKLSMADVAGIFSGKITNWDSPELKASNPGVALPNHQIVVVVRSDGSGATAQFKLWMLRQFPADYAYLTAHTGGSATSASSYFPTGSLSNFVAQNGSNGVTIYTSQNQYTIDYDEYSYAQAAGFPVAQVENAAGYYTIPTASAVAVALTQAIIDTNVNDPNYLSQNLSKVYTYKDPRTYTMSLYSYEIMPKQTNAITTNAKGATLAWLNTNAVCEWQREMGSLGYSPLPMNLVLASLDQVLQTPGIDAATRSKIAATQKGTLDGGTNPCNNPTFKPGDSPSHNVLVDTAPFPAGCNSACQAPWITASAATNVSSPTFTGSAVKGTAKTTAQVKAPTAKGVATSAATAAAQACDPTTSTCSSAQGAADVVNAVPTVLGGQSGWAGPQTLALVLGALTAAILLAPPLVSRALRRRGGRR
ncbi:MAG: hypothetical protein JWP75_4036 [Frondihabitans sp.]|nr:hypothetical protein [Frondihabitans sp.]